jgi:hypothetical protein
MDSNDTGRVLMKRRLLRAVFWGVICALLAALVRWDLENHPLHQEEGRAFTVIEAPSAESGSSGRQAQSGSR